MVKKIRLKGFSALGYFPGIEDLLEEYLAEEARVPLYGAVSCSKSDTKTSTLIAADDDPQWDREDDWTETTLTIVVRQAELKDLATFVGADYEEPTNGPEMEESTLDESPPVALNFRGLKGGGGYRCFRYYNARLISYEVTPTTKGEGTGTQDYTLNFSCKGRAYDGRVRGTKDFDSADGVSAWLNTIPAMPDTQP